MNWLPLRDRSHSDRVILLLLWVLVLLWVRPWSGDLRSDPLTYACVSKDMVENNHWLSPELNGEPYINKPPFYFWLVAVSFKLFGVQFYAAKIPSLVFATLDVLLVYWVVFRWTRNYDTAFFSSFSFLATRWIVRNFAANRPESLLVLSLLLGCYAVVLINERKTAGPYLFGLSCALAFMTKLFFAAFLPIALLLFGLLNKRLLQWLRWKHFYMGILAGIAVSAAWGLYFDAQHPGYFGYILKTQTMLRVVEGLDVNKDPLMYLKEMLKYYHPWLLFLILGIPVLWRGWRTNEYYVFVSAAVLVIFLPIQIAQGKADRYLTILTPFISFIAALGVGRFAKAAVVIKGVARYAVVPLFLVFWLIPVRVNPEKYHVLHLAEQLSSGKRVDYTSLFAFLNTKGIRDRGHLQFVEWTPSEPGSEYRQIFYFYLAGSFVHWDQAAMNEWAELGGAPVVLLTRSDAVGELPRDRIAWVELKADKYHALLTGTPR
ncbi:MAG: glycosyltransferase family 39 protein [Nitrospirota bacterium]|nr:glycosyltransferase family 39 protein [Nitrospirota bacterium]